MNDRTPPAPLEEYYQRCCTEQSDINEHLPLLRDLASECEHVTEFGLRWANGSTAAFLAAQPAEFISWDIDPAAITSQTVRDLATHAGRTKFQPRCGNTLKIPPIEPTDLLFIDSFHTAKHLLRELERHVDPIVRPVRKYIVFHDTVTFGNRGEDGSEPGIRAAIRQFQRLHSFPLWNMVHAKRGIMDFKNNNGLIVITAEAWNEEMARQ